MTMKHALRGRLRAGIGEAVLAAPFVLADPARVSVVDLAPSQGTLIGERVAAELQETWISTVRDAPSAEAGILGVSEAVTAALDARGAVSGCPLGNLALELSLTDVDLRAALAGEYHQWREAIAERIRRDQQRGKGAIHFGSRRFRQSHRRDVYRSHDDCQSGAEHRCAQGLQRPAAAHAARLRAGLNHAIVVTPCL